MNSTADAPRSAESVGDDAAPILRATGVHKTYHLGRVSVKVLAGVDLDVRRGEFVSIMGRSGSGKSTLLHILGALDVPERGQVLFEERPTFAPEDRRRERPGLFDTFSAYEQRRNLLRRRHFGFVFQFYHLLPELNVLENVLLARMVGARFADWPREKNAARRDACAMLERMGLGDRLKHRPNELSGGERQRVAIARALVHRPQILYADEPTGNLDAEAGANIMGILLDLHAEGQTIVMVTHDRGIAERADRMLQLQDGRLRPA
ncbi:MAG: ABC transporter ATP-binding protein [Planctomycetota bacterium]|nr:MAG: ABC transporter ATP-binding protein [Planctomycetota bacterium]